MRLFPSMLVATVLSITLPAAAQPAAASTPEPAAAAPAASPPTESAPAVSAPADSAATNNAPADGAAKASDAAPGEKLVVAILDLKATGGAEASAAALTTMLTAEVSSLAGFQAISRNELKSILAHQADAQTAGCQEISCMGDVATLVNAKRVLTGQVSKLEGATAISLTLVDTSGREPKIAARQEAAWRGRDDELLLLARPLVQRLFDAEHAGSHVGNIELFAADGASVILDGKDAGVTPFKGPLRDLPTGAHTVQVQKDGYLPQEMDLVVARNETTLARVDLQELALTDRPWFWAAAGGVVLLAGGTAAGITTWAVLNQPHDTKVALGALTK